MAENKPTLPGTTDSPPAEPEPEVAAEPVEAEVVDEPETPLARRDQPAPPAPYVERHGITPQEAAERWNAIMVVAEGVYRAGMAPKGYRSGGAVAAVMLYGGEMGLGPMEALNCLHNINGKIGMEASFMRGRITQRCPGAEIIVLESSRTRCAFRGLRPGKPPVEVEWTIVEASNIKAKEGDKWIPLSETTRYKNYPEDMLFARATARLARRQYADCFLGAPYTPDELAANGLPAPVDAPSADPNAPYTPPRRERSGEADGDLAFPKNNEGLYLRDTFGRVKLMALYKGAYPQNTWEHFQHWVADETGGATTVDTMTIGQAKQLMERLKVTPAAAVRDDSAPF